jgi:hypothetical protein
MGAGGGELCGGGGELLISGNSSVAGAAFADGFVLDALFFFDLRADVTVTFFEDFEAGTGTR